MDGVIAALRRYDTPTLSNAIETFGVRPRDDGFADMSVRCMFPDLAPLVGYAATATIRARGATADADQPALYDHTAATAAPRIVVVQDLDQPPGHGALWGEVQSTIFKALGCAGTITDGCVRDLNEVHAIGFQLFARGPCVSHANVRVEEVGVPVTVGGLTVNTGDLLHADQHGVLLIPREIANELPAAAAAVVAREQELLRWVRSDQFAPARLSEMRRVPH
jgi:regulator of RNase E activity RraA